MTFLISRNAWNYFYQIHPNTDQFTLYFDKYSSAANTVLFSDKVNKIKYNGPLGTEESAFVQAEFNKMLMDPQKYLEHTVVKVEPELEEKLTEVNVESLKSTIVDLNEHPSPTISK